MSIDEKAAIKLWQKAINHISEAEPKSLEWARSIGPRTFQKMSSRDFLKKYCFVVYASGFKYTIVKSRFPMIEEAFCSFDLDMLAKKQTINDVLKVFGNRRKAEGFLKGAKKISTEGFLNFKSRLKRCGSEALQELPGIGRITKFHLAKNIGLVDAAKPDVWLERAAVACETDVNTLVEFIHKKTGESRHTIDVAIWTLAKDGKLNG